MTIKPLIIEPYCNKRQYTIKHGCHIRRPTDRCVLIPDLVPRNAGNQRCEKGRTDATGCRLLWKEQDTPVGRPPGVAPYIYDAVSVILDYLSSPSIIGNVIALITVKAKNEAIARPLSRSYWPAKTVDVAEGGVPASKMQAAIRLGES